MSVRVHAIEAPLRIDQPLMVQGRQNVSYGHSPLPAAAVQHRVPSIDPIVHFSRAVDMRTGLPRIVDR